MGKTSLLVRYVQKTFSDSQEPTVSATYLTKKVRLVGEEGSSGIGGGGSDGRMCELNVWDTAGQERFHALGPIYYRDADAAVLVYDITDADSFARVKSWVKELRSIAGGDTTLCVCANKIDLERARAVSTADGEAYAKSIGADFFSTSAKADKGVEQAFMSVARALDTKRENAAHAKGGRDSLTSVSGARGRSLKIAQEEAPPKGGECC